MKMQVEQNFIELNYNAHFKGQTKKKEAHPVAGQDCIRTTRLHGVTNQTSTKRIFTNVKISDLIQKKIPAFTGTRRFNTTRNLRFPER